MHQYRRFAVYFAPRSQSRLGRFGSAWFGWDAERGVECAGLELEGLPRPRAELVATPRRYGFHATLKAPFRLAAGAETAALDCAVRDLAAEFARFAFPLGLSEIGAFLALVPDVEADIDKLSAIADACVRRLDRFTAPPTPHEVARRTERGLVGREAEYLQRWGYPYVLERFSFHMTLTGALSREDQNIAGDVLKDELEPVLAAPVAFDDVCLCGEDADGRFHVLGRHPLRAGAPARR